MQRVLPAAERDQDRANVAIFAALLHDVGHGPFSHAFERVQKGRGAEKDHEQWTAEIILSEGGSIHPILEQFSGGLAKKVADLLRAKNPTDAYHAIVSSSFDADRLDYLRRDRMMTGSGAGAIDFDWLLDNLDVGTIPIGSDDDESDDGLRTFCLKRKALQAAESFLLARYHLFEQVYLHKTTRGMETLVGRLLRLVADASANEEFMAIGLDARDPLIAFFGPTGGTIEQYLALDDSAVWAAANRIARSEDPQAAELARRLIDRKRLFCLDLESRYPRREGDTMAETEARWREEAERIDNIVGGDPTVVKDVVTFGSYGQIGADQTQAHKRLMILVDDGPPREITALSDIVSPLSRRELIRYYFDSSDTRRRFIGEGL